MVADLHTYKQTAIVQNNIVPKLAMVVFSEDEGLKERNTRKNSVIFFLIAWQDDV